MGEIMNDEQIKTRIRRFLESLGSVRGIRDDDDIFVRGFLSSLHAMRLVRFVEVEFGMVIGDEDLEISNFRSINSIAQLVGNKSQG